jgi:tripartite-type tricarboxylate transporter receptor subunit TctC
MDPAILKALQDGFRDALHDPAHLAVLDRLDMSVAYLGSEDYAAAAKRQYEEDGAMIRRLGLKAS